MLQGRAPISVNANVMVSFATTMGEWCSAKIEGTTAAPPSMWRQNNFNHIRIFELLLITDDQRRQGDIVVAAVGRPHLVKEDWIKSGAVVLDVGINRLADGAIVGDVDFDRVQHIAQAITPVPGGIGPMTVACLLLNTVLAAVLQNGFDLSDISPKPLKDNWCPL